MLVKSWKICGVRAYSRGGAYSRIIQYVIMLFLFRFVFIIDPFLARRVDTSCKYFWVGWFFVWHVPNGWHAWWIPNVNGMLDGMPDRSDGMPTRCSMARWYAWFMPDDMPDGQDACPQWMSDGQVACPMDQLFFVHFFHPCRMVCRKDARWARWYAQWPDDMPHWCPLSQMTCLIARWHVQWHTWYRHAKLDPDGIPDGPDCCLLIRPYQPGRVFAWSVHPPLRDLMSLPGVCILSPLYIKV